MPGDLTDSDFWDKMHSRKAIANDRLFGPIRQCLLWKFNRMICQMLDATGEKRADILELGCAPGDILTSIHRLRPRFRLAGIDYSKEGIEITRKRLVGLGIEAEIHSGDFRTVRLPKRFDAAVSFGLIEHFEDPIEILKYHKNFVAPGGLVGVSVPNFTHPFVRNLLRRSNPDILRTHNLTIMDEMSLLRAMQSCGLQNISVGSAGGPRIEFKIMKPRVDFYLYDMAAKIWNFIAAVTPDMFWQAHVWGFGLSNG